MPKPEKCPSDRVPKKTSIYNCVSQTFTAIIKAKLFETRQIEVTLSLTGFVILVVLAMVGAWCAIAHYLPLSSGRFNDRLIHNYPYPSSQVREQSPQINHFEVN